MAKIIQSGVAASGGGALSKRSFLFLQGVCSPFFARLADRLRAGGHLVHKVQFNGGDIAYWNPRVTAHSFREKLENLADFLEDLYQRHAISDQVLFGDRRPVHRPAINRGEGFGIRTHVYEEGYFRPHWVTLERDGVNGHSKLPRDPDWFYEVGGKLAENPQPVSVASPFVLRAFHDVAYHLGSVLNPLLFPRYQTHAPVIAPLEYAGYGIRFTCLPLWQRRDEHCLKNLLSKPVPVFLFPLQLNSDAQIRDHSRFQNMLEAIEFVMDSFARQGVPGSQLLIKNHPLDMGLVNYGRYIRKRSEHLGLQGRVHYVETGDMRRILPKVAGVVTVNSTVGTLALSFNCPTLALSDPIYNLPGLCFQGGIDDFWRSASPPNREMFIRFRRVVMQATQVNGGFYCGPGIALAVENSLPWLTSEVSPLEKLL